MKIITKSKEDYIKAIYHLEKELNKPVKSIELVHYLKISKPSVSEMIKKLAKADLLSYKAYTKLNLTKKGIKEAEKITYKHRVIEMFLTKILKLDSSLIHEEGNRLEHAFSDQAIDKICALLKHPKFCPHGKPIPKIKTELKMKNKNQIRKR